MIEVLLALGWLLALGSAAAVLAARAHAAHREAAVARAAHELRGPLTAMGLVLHAAGRDREALAPSPAGVPPTATTAPTPAGAAWARWLAALELEVDRTRLALADLERAGHATRRLRPHAVTAPAPPAPTAAELVDVGALLRCQSTGWAAAAPTVGRALRVVVGREGLVVRGDAVRLAQAIGNLLANAMEHGDGTVVLSAARAGGRVRIEVADEGRGLRHPVGRLLAREPARGPRGHGLAIAADAAERHGGRLVTAPSATGARLVLELPAAILDEDAVPEAS